MRRRGRLRFTPVQVGEHVVEHGGRDTRWISARVDDPPTARFRGRELPEPGADALMKPAVVARVVLETRPTLRGPPGPPREPRLDRQVEQQREVGDEAAVA